MSRSAQPSETSSPWNLVALTPEYLEVEHSGYVLAIECALADSQIRNIALSGNYGVGKSSILREVARRQDGRVVELSLSTLAPIEASKIDDSVPIQVTTPTNRIQQEIVKQLLYLEDPSKTPGSRFRRIERFHWGREAGTAVVLGLAVAVVFLLTGWTAQIASVFTTLIDIGLWTHLIVWAVAVTIVLLLRWLFYGRLRIKELSAGSASVTLDDNSLSYFDQYLDEIVYFFDVSDRDIVIFEDIDRFNDSHIFETLRALNTLLNASPQIVKPIRFIYAIKDSIFDRIGLETEGRKVEPDATDDPAQAEAVCANRTKFFDLVIPVVPFITHRSARSLAAQLLGEIEHDVESELLDLAAQYVPDMRLLKNVRNEFIVFRDRIFSGDGEQLDLSQTDLFAMMLYKSTHLTDFEKIRLGTSTLDVLYMASRELVAENIKRIEDERRALRQRLTNKSGAEARSLRLGDLLVAHVERTAGSAAVFGHRRRNGLTFSVDGDSKSDEDLRSTEFWAAFVAADGDPELRQQMSTGHALTFSRSSLVGALGDPLDTESWSEADRAVLTEQIDERTEEIAFLRSADLGALIKRPEFLVSYEDTEQSFEAAAKALMNPGLTYQLVRAGYINRNFTLYTSTFHGNRVSPAATNFIIHHVERDLMDEHFALDSDDIDAVVRERGKNALKEPALYNIAILDRLLDLNADVADIMIRSLASLGDTQRQFLQAYLDAGIHRRKLIERLTPMSSRVLTYLVNEVELDDSSRFELVDAVLANLSADTKYRTDEATSAYLLEHYTKLPTVYSDETSVPQAARIADIFATAGVVLPTLSPSRENLRRELVARNLYEITLANLLTIGMRGAGPALDSLAVGAEAVYKYCLDNLTAYLDAIDEGNYSTVESVQQFAGILEDVVERGDSAHLERVVSGASEECVVESLSDVVPDAWPVLAKHQRFPATFGNTTLYIESVGSIDPVFAALLTASETISETEGADEDSKEALAKTVLNARTVHSTAPPHLRALLVESLALENYLDVDDVPIEKGELFASLLEHNVIADDVASYERLATTDWLTRKAFMLASNEFANYLTPELLQPDLAAMLADEEIDTAVKHAVIEQCAVYAEVADRRGLSEMARFALQHECELPPDVVQQMAQGNVPVQQIVPFLELHLSAIGRDQLFTILSAFGGEYGKLTAVGYGTPKIPNTAADRALLERLKQDDIVNSYDENEALIRVNKRRK